MYLTHLKLTQRFDTIIDAGPRPINNAELAYIITVQYFRNKEYMNFLTRIKRNVDKVNGIYLIIL
jgi:hypothetical protein